MRDDIIGALAALQGKIGFCYKCFATGEELLHNASEQFVSASMIKLFILATALEECEKGSLDKNSIVKISKEKCVPSCGALSYMHNGTEVTICDLYTLMIILSDNTATNYMIDILGKDKINRFILSQGFLQTRLERKMMDFSAIAAGKNNYTSPADLSAFFERLYYGKLVSQAASAEMLEILKNQQQNECMAFYISAEPSPPQIAHKTGGLDNVSLDAGIVFAKSPFIAVFCANDTYVPEFDRTAGEITLSLYQKHNK